MDYIIYTTEGYTLAPDGTGLENCQIIDFLEAGIEKDKNELLDEYWMKHGTLVKIGFTREKLRVRKIY